MVDKRAVVRGAARPRRSTMRKRELQYMSKETYSLLRIVDFLVSTMCKRELQYMSKETYCATEEILYFVEFAWSMSSSANR